MNGGNRPNLPNMSFKTFINFLTSMQSGLPARVDRSYWSQLLNGSNGKAVTNALIFFGLIDNQTVPTENLKKYHSLDVKSQVNLLAKLIKESYSKAFDGKLQLNNVTMDQLRELIKSYYNPSKEDTEKCVKFLNDACKHTGIPLSSSITQPRRKKTNNTKIVQKTDKNNEKLSVEKIEIVQKPVKMDNSLASKLPEYDNNWSDEMKFLWMQCFNELIKQNSKA